MYVHLEKLCFFKSEGLGGQVANLGGAVVLDGARVGKAGFHCPLGSVLFEEFEGLTVEFNQCLADNGLILAVASFDIHHLGDGHTACDPLVCGLGEVGNLGKVSVVAVLNQHEGVVAEGVAVIRIEIGRERAAAFIAEEVMQGRELALVGTGSLARGKVVLNEGGEQLFRLDQRNLNVAMRVALEEQLLLNAFRQNGEYRHGFLGQAVLDEGVLFLPAGKGVEGSGLFAGEQLVDFGNQNGELGNEFYDTFWNDGYAEVPALGGAIGYGISDIVGNLGQRHLLGGNFFADQADVRLGFQRTFQRYVGSGAAHDLYKVPVFLCGVGVALDVADQLAVGFGSGVESEGALDVFVLKVAVDGLGAADYLNAGVVSSKVLGQNGCIGVGVVAADDDNSGDAVAFAYFCNHCELLFGFKLGSAGADDIETSGISVLVDILIIKDDIVVVQKAAGAALKAVQYVGGAGCLKRIVQTADNVVSARSLAAGKDNADDLLLGFGGIFALLEGDFVFAVGVGEQRLDFFLIGYAFSSRALLIADFGNTVSGHTGQVGGVLISCDLQGGQLHIKNTPSR